MWIKASGGKQLTWFECGYHVEFQITVVIKGAYWDFYSAVRNDRKIKQLGKLKIDLGVGDMESHSVFIMKLNVVVRWLGGHTFKRSVTKILTKCKWYGTTGNYVSFNGKKFLPPWKTSFVDLNLKLVPRRLNGVPRRLSGSISEKEKSKLCWHAM